MALVFRFLLMFIPVLSFAQNKIEADDIIEQINNGENVSYINAEIIGDLDFTKVYDVEKSYASSSAM